MDRLSRLPNESDFAYHKRLVMGKLVDGTLSDEDYAELAPLVYGKPYSSDVARRMMYGSCRTLQLLDQQTEQEIKEENLLQELDEKRLAYQKERQKYFDQRNAYHQLIRERARQEELNEIIADIASSGKLPALFYEPSPEITSDNDILVSLNDLHYGAFVNNYWNTYNSNVCQKMMGRYLDRIIAIGQLHQSENCIIWANGDEISGNIHHSISVTNKENVIEQIMGAAELIAEFVAELSKYFTKVKFVSVAGNHSRLDQKKKALKDERLDDLIEWYLAARLQNFANVEIGAGQKIDATMYLLDIRGKTYCGVHGDYDGSVAKVQSLQTMVQQPLYAILSGHLHHNKLDWVQGVRTVMAGSFLGMDDFCVANRIYGKPQQLICICDHTGIRCSYDIDLA